MPAFGNESLIKLGTCHPDLQRVMHETIKHFDFQIIEGHRGEEAQNTAFKTGKSKLQYPHGNHNATPSNAVDIAPYPVDWSDNPKAIERFVYLAGHVMCCAQNLGIKLRWGGDWTRDQDTRNEKSFRDYPHFEIDQLAK